MLSGEALVIVEGRYLCTVAGHAASGMKDPLNATTMIAIREASFADCGERIVPARDAAHAPSAIGQDVEEGS